MNSLMQEREVTHPEQPDRPAAAPSSMGTAALDAPPAHTPAALRHPSRRYLALLLGGAAVLVLLGVWLPARTVLPFASSGAAADGGIVVEDAWARAAIRPAEGAGGTSAVYMQIRNQGGDQDQLLGAISDAAVTTEVHRTLVEDGVMRMRPAGPIEIPAGGTLTLQPGGFHVMLIDLQRDLVAGERLAVTLHFERAGDLLVDAEVRAPMQAPMSAPMHGR